MSESEGKRELSGFARSIDALFSSAQPAAEPAPSIEPPSEVVEEPTQSAARPPLPEVEISEPAFEVPVSDEPIFADATLDDAAPAGEPIFDETVLDQPVLDETMLDQPILDETAVLDETVIDQPVLDEPSFEEPVLEAPDEPALEEPVFEEPVLDEPAFEEPALDESADAEPALDDAADAEPVPEEAGMEEPLPEPAAPSIADAYQTADAPEEATAPEAATDTGEGDDDEQPTELDLAVDAYIEGDLGRADDIKRLADEMLERRELEPIARSVARITTAAGDPPDTSVFAVAESIISPVVLARLARRIGAEREEEKRREYYSVCRVIGKDMAIAIRNDLADETDRLARRVHCEALVEMGPAGRDVIEEMAVDENRFLVRNAVAMLGDLGGDRAVELVTSALANPDARVRREALKSMAKLGDAESGELAVGLLDDSDSEVRVAAAVAAGELKVERALRPIIAMLDATKDPEEALPLIRALGQLADPGAVSSIERFAVRSLFSRPPTDVRITAYRALSAMGTPHARRLLNKAVNDKDPEVKAAVKEMLHLR